MFGQWTAMGRECENGVMVDGDQEWHGSHLDDRTCRLICPIAAAMVGVCLTTIGIIQVAIRARHIHTLADDLLTVDAVLFLGAMLSSYFALRVQSVKRHHRLEQIADVCFIVAMVVLTIACFIVTYWVGQ